MRALILPPPLLMAVVGLALGLSSLLSGRWVYASVQVSTAAYMALEARDRQTARDRRRLLAHLARYERPRTPAEAPPSE